MSHVARRLRLVIPIELGAKHLAGRANELRESWFDKKGEKSQLKLRNLLKSRREGELQRYGEFREGG